ncbi:MAG TPA: hypothetical protein VF221_19505 [Chloroflexota bacterium]
MDESSIKDLEQVASRLREGQGREKPEELQLRALFLVAAALERIQIQLDDINNNVRGRREFVPAEEPS